MAADTGVQKLVLDQVELEQVGEGMNRRLVWGREMMMACISLGAGTSVPKHRHPNEQITYLLAGEIDSRFGDDGEDQRHISASEILVISRDMPPCGEGPGGRRND